MIADARKTRLPWLGPALLAVGVVVGIAGAYFMARSRPHAGAVMDVVAISPEFAAVIRDEADPDGTRNFVQLVHVKRGVEWTAMVPRYAGRPGVPAIGWAENAISVRVIRGGLPEVWSLSTIDASKLGQVSLSKHALGTPVIAPSPVVTATDGTRSFEVVDGTLGTRLVAFDLHVGSTLWRTDFARESIRALEVHGPALRVTTTDGATRWIDVLTGEPARDATPVAQPEPPPRSRRYHVAGTAAWTVVDDRTLAVLDTQTGGIVATVAID